MARTSEVTVEIPKDVAFELDGKTVTLTSGGKKLERAFKAHGIKMRKKDNSLELSVRKDRKKSYATMKSIEGHVKNMVLGLKKGFEYQMEIVYSHFPMNVTVKGNVVEISNLAGGKRIARSKIVGQTKVEVKGKDVMLKGPSKEDVGQTAANMETATRIKGKDERIFQDGIYIVRKARPVLEEAE